MLIQSPYHLVIKPFTGPTHISIKFVLVEIYEILAIFGNLVFVIKRTDIFCYSGLENYLQSKKEGKDQEQLSITPDPGYQSEIDNFTIQV